MENVSQGNQSRSANVVRSLRFRIPGSTSNLGPGFDAMALALSMYCRVAVLLLEHADAGMPLVTFKGAVAKRSLPKQLDQLLYRLLKGLWRDGPEVLERLRFEVDSDIPLGCGLGGSGAIILGALWGSYILQDKIPSPAALLAEAALIEGYGESLAASMMGGLVVCAPAIAGGGIIARRHEWPERWRPIFVVPPYRLETPDMRACLPRQVSFADASFNLARAALLVSAVCREDDAAMKEALHDRLHEAARSSRAPLLAEVRRLLTDLPVIGCALSGAGPAVMVLTKRADTEVVEAHLQAWADEQAEELSIVTIDADSQGISEI